MLNTADRGGDRHRDDLVRPDGEAREGHRRRRGADRGDQRDRRRLHRLLRQGRRPVGDLLDRLRHEPAELTLVALVLTIIIVIATKAYTGRGTPLRGGVPSGHAAIAFAGWMAATYVAGASHRFLVSSIALIMAFLVAQTRVESGVHSALEVTYGALVGALATLVVFQVFS